jgi:glycosyltransferase involved in cell wall biosynthesis
MIVANARLLLQPRTGQPRYFEEVRRRLTMPMVTVAPSRLLPAVRAHAWEQLVLPAKVRGQLLWSPGNTGPLATAAQVVTIHDVAMLEHPEWFSPLFASWYRHLIPRLVKRVAHVMTVSEFSKGEIVERCGIPPEKVTVAPCAVDGSWLRSHDGGSSKSAARALRLDRPYVLAVGSVQPRKNLARLIEAWSVLGSLTNELELIVAGGTFGSVFADTRLPPLPPNVRLLGYVEETLLPSLYAGAEFFCYPSLYEGFGMPPLEAMAAGVAVLTSDCTALPEAVGDAALLVDPMDVDSIADGITRLISDRALRADLVRRGALRTSAFTWDDTAEIVDRVLHRFSRGGGG